MASQHTRRPDAATAERQAEAIAKAQAEKAQADLAQEARRAQQKAEDGQDVSADVAAQLQKGLGNSAVAAMLRKGSESDTSTSNAEATQEEAKDEEQDEGEDVESEVERALPSFSTGGGGGGGGGTSAPWSVGRMFGGEDDADDDIFERFQPKWRPMPSVIDPDEEVPEPGDEDDDAGAAPDDEDGTAWEEAEARFGSAPWEPGVLSRGLRHPRRLPRPGFAAEALALEPQGVWARGRTLLRWLGRQGRGAPVRALARAAVATGVPEELGHAGSIAAQLAQLEALFGADGAMSAILADVASERRARAAVDEEAGRLLDNNRLSGTAILLGILGNLPAVETGEWPETCGAAALDAVEQAAWLAALPVVDVWIPPVRDLPEDDIDRVLRAFTGVEDEDDTSREIRKRDVWLLFSAVNGLLGAIGGVQVELAAASLAVWPYGRRGVALGVLRSMDTSLRQAARRLVGIGQRLEACLGTDAFDEVVALSRQAAALRDAVEAARAQALRAIATAVDPEGIAPEPDPFPDLEVSLQTGAVRAVLDRTAEDIGGSVVLAAAGVRVAGAHAGADRMRALSTSPVLPTALRVACRIQAMLGSWLGGDVAAAARDAHALGAVPVAVAPYLGALCAMVRAEAGEEAALDLVGAELLLAGEGAALNLVKTRWVERRFGAVG